MAINLPIYVLPSGVISGSLIDSASYSSYALTSSYALNVDRSLLMDSASYALNVDRSLLMDSASYSITSSHTSDPFVAYINQNNYFTGSITISGSHTINHGLWFGNGDTGFYEPESNVLYARVNGVNTFEWRSGYFQSVASGGPRISNEIATSTNPVFISKYDSTTGIGFDTAATGSLIAGGVNVMNWHSGSVDVNGSLNLTENIIVSGSSGVNLFGSLPTDLHRFTGSVHIDGNLYVDGNEILVTPLNSISSSYAITSSYAANAGTSFAGTSMYVPIFTAGGDDIEDSIMYQSGSNIVITGSLITTDNTGVNIFGSNLTDLHQFTGSVNITGSLEFSVPNTPHTPTTSSATFYLDEGNDNLMVSIVYSDGTVKSGSVDLY